jgi:hypothetical protein
MEKRIFSSKIKTRMSTFTTLIQFRVSVGQSNKERENTQGIQIVKGEATLCCLQTK